MLAGGLQVPSASSVAGMVRRVLEAGADRWTAMEWLERRLALHVLAAQLPPDQARAIITGTLAQLPPSRDERDAGARLTAAAIVVYRQALSDGGAEVRQHLDRAWLDAATALVEHWPAVADFVPWLGVARRWLIDVETAEQYA